MNLNYKEELRTLIVHLFGVLGWKHPVINIEEMDPGAYEVTTLTLNGCGSINFYVRMEERKEVVRTIATSIITPVPYYLFEVEVCSPGSYWEPPDACELELAASRSLAECVIDGLLTYLKDQMHNSLPQPDIPQYDITEDVPQ